MEWSASLQIARPHRRRDEISPGASPSVRNVASAKIFLVSQNLDL